MSSRHGCRVKPGVTGKMEKNHLKEPGAGRIFLIAVALALAIGSGFVLGLKMGPTLFGGVDEPLVQMDEQYKQHLDPEKESANEAEQAVDSVAAAAEASKRDMAKGKDYLAGHNQWDRNEMEKIPSLQGLWDAVNNYKVDDLRSYNEKLDSATLTTIIEKLEENPKEGSYASKTDEVITISAYIKAL